MNWTDKHTQEASARLYQLAAEKRIAGADRAADFVAHCAGVIGIDEHTFRRAIGCGADDPDPSFDSVRRARELRRLDALATGRLTRSCTVVYRVRSVLGYLMTATANNTTHQWCSSFGPGYHPISTTLRQVGPLEFTTLAQAKRAAKAAGEGSKVVTIRRTTIRHAPKA